MEIYSAKFYIFGRVFSAIARNLRKWKIALLP